MPVDRVVTGTDDPGAVLKKHLDEIEVIGGVIHHITPIVGRNEVIVVWSRPVRETRG